MFIERERERETMRSICFLGYAKKKNLLERRVNERNFIPFSIALNAPRISKSLNNLLKT